MVAEKVLFLLLFLYTYIYQIFIRIESRKKDVIVKRTTLINKLSLLLVSNFKQIRNSSSKCVLDSCTSID